MREFDVNGVIVSNDDAWIYDWYDMENTCPKKIKNFLEEANGEPVVININSGGGDLYAGINIHDKLKAYSGELEIHVTGLAASAASIIAMAGKCLMSPASTLMIHNVACTDYGNKQAKQKTAKDLAVFDKGIVAVYAAKTGMAEDEIAKMMDKETFIDAKSAVEMGFVDGLLGVESGEKYSNSMLMSSLLPEAVINKTRQMILMEARGREPQTSTEPETNVEPSGTPISSLYKRLNLLRR